MSGLAAWVRTQWRTERPTAPLWVPVLIGLGVQIYFWAASEPPGWLIAAALASPLLLAGLLWPPLRAVRLLLACVVLVSIGFGAAGLRARLVAAPVLAGPVDAVVEGTIREMSRTNSGRPRLLMDDLVIFGRTAGETPAFAQVALQKEDHAAGLSPGARVSVLAHVGPPGGPVEPGGFDYRRNAWFKSLGAIGYARGPPAAVALERAPGLFRSLSLWLAHARADLAAGLRARLPGETGAFAAAVTVGDRAGVSTASTEALRDSNLSHLLAISGLHMGLVTALVFGAARLILAALPHTARRWRVKRVAAMVALLAATAYLALSGASIATQRAFIMATVALTAAMMNRPAITLRALAVAATIILLIRPESLVGVGFQMSFAATAAIIAGFDYARAKGWSARLGRGGPGAKVAGYVLALAATSLLAGLATAPFAAYHFNRVANYGLIANLAAVPAMGFWVAPSALVAAALAPFGLETWALTVMGRGIETIMSVARFVAGLDGATRGVAATLPVVLTLIALGGLGLCLGRRALRVAGAAAVVCGFALWLGVDARPEALVAPGGRLVGVMGEAGRALDHPKTQAYAARNWLEADGDGADQRAAADRPGFTEGYAGSVATLSNGWRVANVLARRPDLEALAALCEPRTLILAAAARAPAPGPCVTLHGESLFRRGALAIRAVGDRIEVETAASEAGDRFWTQVYEGPRR